MSFDADDIDAWRALAGRYRTALRAMAEDCFADPDGAVDHYLDAEPEQAEAKTGEQT